MDNHRPRFVYPGSMAVLAALEPLLGEGAAGAAAEGGGGGMLGRLKNFAGGAGGHSSSVQDGAQEPSFDVESTAGRVHNLMPK